MSSGLIFKSLKMPITEEDINSASVLTCFTKRDPSFSGSSRHFSNSPKKKLETEKYQNSFQLVFLAADSVYAEVDNLEEYSSYFTSLSQAENPWLE